MRRAAILIARLIVIALFTTAQKNAAQRNGEAT
jgi:hypothetical protein